MKLIIKESGYSLELPGMGLIRTPCNVDITRCNINIVISTLIKNGVIKYSIVENPEESLTSLPKNTKVIKADKTKNVVVHKVENANNTIEFAKLSKRFTELQDFITKSFESVAKSTSLPPEYIERLRKEDKKFNPKVEELIVDDSDDEFIPEINLDDLEMSGSKTEILDMDDNISSDVDILRELKGGK